MSNIKSISQSIGQLEILPVMEQFYTVQGEGANTGKPAYFIRLAGCDIACHWCDVKDSWDEKKHPKIDIAQLLKNAKKNPGKLIVVTGGEPAIHNLNSLTQLFKKNGFTTSIETSGAYTLSGEWDWVCLSPKKTKAPIDSVFSVAHELKVVIYNKNDFEWAEKNAEKISQKNSNCRLFLQPEWSRRELMMPKIVDYVKQNPQWNISLQTHKYLNIP